MSDDIEGPLPEQSPQPQQEQPAKDRHAGASGVPTRQECMQALGRLPGLIALKVISTQQANAIRGTYQTVLNEIHRSTSDGGTAAVADDNVMALLKANPDLLNLVEPLLTDQQVRDVVERGQGHVRR